MKKSHTVKIGARLISILVFIWVFNYLKGKDIFKHRFIMLCMTG